MNRHHLSLGETVPFGQKRLSEKIESHRMVGLAGLAIATIIGVASCRPLEPLLIWPATMAATPSARNHAEGNGYVLIENATLSTRVRFSAVQRWGLSITARAEPADGGAWPQVQIEINGVPTHTIVVEDRRAIPYWLNFASEPGFADLQLSLLNGTAAAGPTLIIERIELLPL